MSRKEAEDSTRGFADVVGVALLALAVLLLVSQLSFDRFDVAANRVPPNSLTRNWVGPFGAHLAHGFFRALGAGAYFLPLVLAAFGLGCLLDSLSHLRRRWIWHGLWTFVFMLSLVGLLHLMNSVSFLDRVRAAINAPSVGGHVGKILFDYGFWTLGPPGAAIVYAALYLISLIVLTNFKLGGWVTDWWQRRKEAKAGLSAEELELERRALELERKKRALEQEVQKAALGVDGQPVPEPTVRDLSVSQPKPASAKPKKPAEPAQPAAPAEGSEVIFGREVRAATTADILGKRSEPTGKAATGAQVPLPQTEGKKPEGATEPEKPAPADAAAPPSALAPPAEPVVLDRSGAVAKRPPKKPKPIAVAAPPLIGNYQLPPIDFLTPPDTTIKPTESREELLANAALMQQTLAQFEITVTPGDITKGPTFTRYELHPAPGVKLERITSLSNNLAAALKAERIHILAPVPGKGSVGIEVPNPVKTKVIMRDLLESDEWRTTRHRIPVVLGKDVYGHPIIQDLSEMPHLLIAGSTGSGKSVCINAIITSLLYRFSPDQLRFVMIDPKVVELQHYNALPHLVVPVVTDPKKVILALRWVVNEMEKRYQIFAKVGVRNIKSFNERPRSKPLPKQELELPLMARKEKVEPGVDGFAVEVDEEIVVPREEDIVIPDKLSYIVVIIDELADLMLVAPADVEMAIARITQMARAAGIHCIVATQRPSVDVITGVIKANITARIAFQCASKVDSRTILDAMGADKLLGKGDMLFLPPGSAKLIRAQGALITDPEIVSIVEFIAKQGKPRYEMDIHQQLQKSTNDLEEDEGIDEDEDLIQQCIEVIRSEQKASVSLLQRRLRLGYTRAARIMDELENRDIVGPSKGAEPRDILIDLDGGGADGSASAGDDDLAQR